MPTPTTVQFQIAVSSTNANGEAAEKVYNLTLTLLVEGPDDGQIRVTLASQGEADSGEVTPLGGGMPVVDPNPDGTTDSQTN